MATGSHKLRDRAGAALIAAALQGMVLYGLIIGLGVRMPAPGPAATQLLDFSLPPPPPVVKLPDPPRPKLPKPKGEAAPPNLVSRATEVVAPPMPLPVPPSPVVAAEKADTGAEVTSGAAPVAGPGTGAGGAGNGNGGGGDGGGTPLRWVRGELKDSDYPKAALDAGASGTVGLRFVVGVEGKVTRCDVTRSSGNAALDETTCRLIVKRFRYKPSRDAAGKPVPDVVVGEHVWELYDRGPPG